MKKDRTSYSIIAALLLILGMMVIITLVVLQLTGQGETRPTVTPSPAAIPQQTPDPLARPVVSEPPTQVEEGQLIYWGVCMACHGNHGQGLTDEWRALAYGEDQNCWASKCHASNHPPQGFEFPHTVPALVGGGRLGRFTSAQQLYDYIVAMMPWWNPNSLTPEKGWQVTAYLLKLNGSLPAGVTLDATVASAIPVHRALSVPRNDTNLALIFAATLALAMVALLLREALQEPLASPGAAGSPAHRRRRRPSFVSHLHPPSIPALQARWRYTLGAGGFSVFLCLVLVATGLLEMFYYIPTPEKAPVMVETLNFFVPLGALVRNLHYWSAQLLVIVAGLHLLRIVFTGAYASPRRFNFLLGMGLFVFVLLLDFTGYVLRWDEGIRWALTAGTNLLSSIPGIGAGLYQFVVGGSQTGPSTLVRFYAWHIFALSTGAAFILIWHLFRVRRDGGISAPVLRAGETSGAPEPAALDRISRSELLRREILGMFIAGILLVLLSAFVPAPLAAPIQGVPTASTDNRAPWFFLWVQQLLKLGDPFLLGVLVPVLTLLLIAAIPYFLPGPARAELGHWFPRRGRIAQVLLALITLILLGLTVLALLPTSNA